MKKKKTRKMKVGIIGLGAIGSKLAELIEKDNEIELGFVFDINEKKMNNFPDKKTINSKEELLSFLKKHKVDLVVEAAGFHAVKVFAAKIMERSSLLIMSGTALAEKKTEMQIKKAAKKYKTKFYMAEGAIIGLDGIKETERLNALKEVEIVTRKPPKGFGFGKKDERSMKEKILFKGKAREACLKYPKNVNVAATLSVKGIGFDKTKVKIISDPNVKANTHEITAKGSFGKFTVKVEAKPSKNPRTSGLAVISCFDMIKRIQQGINIY